MCATRANWDEGHEMRFAAVNSMATKVGSMNVSCMSSHTRTCFLGSLWRVQLLSYDKVHMQSCFTCRRFDCPSTVRWLQVVLSMTIFVVLLFTNARPCIRCHRRNPFNGATYVVWWGSKSNLSYSLAIKSVGHIICLCSCMHLAPYAYVRALSIATLRAGHFAHVLAGSTTGKTSSWNRIAASFVFVP